MDEKRKPQTMRKWRKAPVMLIKLFGEMAAVLPPDTERRKMFGYPCIFVNGQLAAGVHQENIMLRLSAAERAAFLALPGAGQFEPTPGRPMREYVVFSKNMMDSPDEMIAWLEKAVAYARTLPPKEERKKKR